MKIITLCRKYLLQHKLQLSVYIAIIFLSTAISILSPYIIGVFLDNLIAGADLGAVLHFCIIFGGLSLVKIIKGYITAVMNTKMQTKMSYDLNMDAIKHIQGLSLSYINRKDSAYLSQRIGSDSMSLVSFCVSVLQSIISNIILLIVPLVILLIMNWFIAVLMMAFLVLYAILYFAFKMPLYNAGFAFRESQAKFFSKLFEQLKYTKIIKVNSIQEQMNRRADKSFVDFRGTAIQNQKVNYLYSGLDGFISTIAQIILFVVGGIQILAGNFTIGMFTIFASYFNMMLGASRYFFGLGASYQNVLVSYDRIREIFEQKLESRGTKEIKSINKIELKDVCFSYALEKDSETRDKSGVGRRKSGKVIKNFNAEFTKGKIYVIAGVNGAGKSTIASLTMGLFVDEYNGTIAYDGVDIRDINMVAVRRDLVGVAEQEPLLINDSIKYNLDYMDEKNYKLSALYECIEILNMKDFICQRTLDFKINEKNTNTSGGERQKISILKVLLKNPDVMIFDEPTSALDAETARRFVEHLQRIKQNKIIIMISHDEVLKKKCDEIVFVYI